MTFAAFATTASGARPGRDEYRPGVCNIGPAEIARRRMVGHVGLLLTVATLAVLVVLEAPVLSRVAVVLPAMVSASGYLQAKLKFCAAFGWRRVFNFGSSGESAAVTDPEAWQRDRRRAAQIALWALGIAAAVGLGATLLPI